MSSSDGDDSPRLSKAALAALREHYKEKQMREDEFQKQFTSTECKNSITFDENWQLSQFWYNENTINTLVRVVENTLPINGKVCLISCPTLYAPVRKALDLNYTVNLLEFDRRFKAYEEGFIYYDFNSPTTVPREIIHSFDLVIADPPFLSRECLKNTAETITLLSKDKIILCTGAIMADLAVEILKVNACEFKPEHKNNLANEFMCFANFDLDDIIKE